MRAAVDPYHIMNVKYRSILYVCHSDQTIIEKQPRWLPFFFFFFFNMYIERSLHRPIVYVAMHLQAKSRIRVRAKHSFSCTKLLHEPCMNAPIDRDVLWMGYGTSTSPESRTWAKGAERRVYRLLCSWPKHVNATRGEGGRINNWKCAYGAVALLENSRGGSLPSEFSRGGKRDSEQNGWRGRHALSPWREACLLHFSTDFDLVRFIW